MRLWTSLPSLFLLHLPSPVLLPRFLNPLTSLDSPRFPTNANLVHPPAIAALLACFFYSDLHTLFSYLGLLLFVFVHCPLFLELLVVFFSGFVFISEDHAR